MNIFHLNYDLHSVYKHNFYHDKQEIIDEIFCHYIKILLKYNVYTELIQERKQNI